jgi:type II secretory pathway pseudopilin PulG
MTLWTRIYAERRGILLPLLVVAVINVAVLLLVVVPLGRSVRAAETEALQATQTLATARQVQRQARDAMSSRERADRELQQFYQTVLPDDFAVAAKTTNRWLQEAAREAGVAYQHANFSWEQIRESSLSRASSTVTLRGRYADVRRFLYSLESANEFLVVEKVELAPSAGSTGTGTLEVSLVVSTFFVTELPR